MTNDGAEKLMRDSPKNVPKSGPGPLPWWATVPPEFFAPKPAPKPEPPPLKADKRVTRRRQTVKRTPGPGRPSVMTDEMIKDAKRMYASGDYSAAAIARELGVSRSTIFRYLDF